MKHLVIALALLITSSFANAGFSLGDLKNAADTLGKAAQGEVNTLPSENSQEGAQDKKASTTENLTSNKINNTKYCIDDGDICLGDNLSDIKVKWVYDSKPTFDSNILNGKAVSELMGIFPHQTSDTYSKLYKSIDSGFDIYLSNTTQDIFVKANPVCQYKALKGEYSSKNGERTIVTFYPLSNDLIKFSWIAAEIERLYPVKTDMGSKIIIDKFKNKYGVVKDGRAGHRGFVESSNGREGLYITLTGMDMDLNDGTMSYVDLGYGDMGSYDFEKNKNSPSCNKLDIEAENKYSETMSTLERTNK